MPASLLLAAALSLATSPAHGCAAQARAECIALMRVLFRSTRETDGVATRRVGGVRARARSIARVPGDRALVVAMEFIESRHHAAPGSWGLYDFAVDGPVLMRQFVDVRRVGTWGAPGEGHIT